MDRRADANDALRHADGLRTPITPTGNAGRAFFVARDAYEAKRPAVAALCMAGKSLKELGHARERDLGRDTAPESFGIEHGHGDGFGRPQPCRW